MSKPKLEPIQPVSSGGLSKSIKLLIECFILLALIFGASIMYQQNMFESLGFAPQKDDVVTNKPDNGKDGAAQPVEAKSSVKYSTIKTAARTMSTVAVNSAVVGAVPKTDVVVSYRIIGTPMTASIYANKAMVCLHTPCSIHVFGDPEALWLEIQEGKKKSSFSLAGKSPDQPVMVVLDK